MVEAPEVPHHHHAKTGLPWFDLMIPLAVVAIGVASLLTSSLQSEKSMHALVDENRRLVEAQSTPLLMLDSSNLNDDGKPALKFKLMNVGTGPAQVRWFHLKDDQGLSYTGGTLYERVAKIDSHASFLSQQVSGSFIRSGDFRLVFEWPKPADGSPTRAGWEALNTTRFGLHASACYCSVFNECRVYGLQREETKSSRELRDKQGYIRTSACKVEFSATSNFSPPSRLWFCGTSALARSKRLRVKSIACL